MLLRLKNYLTLTDICRLRKGVRQRPVSKSDNHPWLRAEETPKNLPRTHHLFWDSPHLHVQQTIQFWYLGGSDFK